VRFREQFQALLEQACGSRHIPVGEGRPAELIEAPGEFPLGIGLTQ
jgi:hypothetical protein